MSTSEHKVSTATPSSFIIISSHFLYSFYIQFFKVIVLPSDVGVLSTFFRISSEILLLIFLRVSFTAHGGCESRRRSAGSRGTINLTVCSSATKQRGMESQLQVPPARHCLWGCDEGAKSQRVGGEQAGAILLINLLAELVGIILHSLDAGREDE